MVSSDEILLLEEISKKLDALLTIERLVNREKIEEELARTLGDGTRRKIFDMCDGEHSVSGMASQLDVSSPAVSQHLSALTEAGLITLQRTQPRRYVKRLEA